MLRELADTRRELAQAVETGNAHLSMILARKYLQLYSKCWPQRL